MKRYVISAILTTIVLLIAQMIIKTDILTAINFCFFWGLISLTGAACCYIWQTGFLDLFLDSFKKVTTIIMPASRSLDRANKQLKEDETLNSWKQSVFANTKMLLLGAGTSMILLSFVGVWA